MRHTRTTPQRKEQGTAEAGRLTVGTLVSDVRLAKKTGVERVNLVPYGRTD